VEVEGLDGPVTGAGPKLMMLLRIALAGTPQDDHLASIRSCGGVCKMGWPCSLLRRGDTVRYLIGGSCDDGREFCRDLTTIGGEEEVPMFAGCKYGAY